MNLTPLQVEIMKRADKTLSFWCIVNYLDKIHFLVDTNCLVSYDGKRMYENEYDYKYITNKDYKIIWQPMNWGRLCWLFFWLRSDTEKRNEFVSYKKNKQEKIEDFRNIWDKLSLYFSFNPNLYNKTVLERDIETQELVLSFLNTLWKDSI